LSLLKKWTNVVLLESFKEAALVGRAEDLGGVNMNMSEDIFPLNMEMPERRTLIGALHKSLEYSRMGLFNIIIKNR